MKTKSTAVGHMYISPEAEVRNATPNQKSTGPQSYIVCSFNKTPPLEVAQTKSPQVNTLRIEAQSRVLHILANFELTLTWVKSVCEMGQLKLV